MLFEKIPLQRGYPDQEGYRTSIDLVVIHTINLPSKILLIAGMIATYILCERLYVFMQAAML